MFSWLMNLINPPSQIVTQGLTPIASVKEQTNQQSNNKWLSSFGYKVSWYMIPKQEFITKNWTINDLAKALNIQRKQAMSWNDGIAHGYQYVSDKEKPLYISSALDGWIYIITASDEKLNLLDGVLSNFYAFGSYRVVDFVAWKQVKRDTIIRHFSQLEGIKTNIGKQTNKEAVLGFVDISGLNIEQAEALAYDDKIIDDENIVSLFTEDDVIDICEHWTGVNPTEFDEYPATEIPEMGIAGYIHNK